MSYNVVTTEGIRTFENIDDAGDYAQAMSLRTGEPAKVFHAETGLVAFTVRAATRDGNTPFVGYAQTRHNAFLYARDEIRKALAAAVDERGAGNPFLPQRDELVTQDMHTCDLCGRWCSSPVYSIGLIYGGQAKTFTEVCADCMWRLKFSPVRTISLDAYRLFEQWRLSQSEADE